MQPDRSTFWRLTPALIVWGSLAFIGQHLPLVADEAYYREWSYRLALGYFDHPPMVAYLIALFDHNPRLAAWCTSSVTLFILTLTARHVSPTLWSHLPKLYVFTPLGISSGLIMTPDIPLLCAWSILFHGLVTRNVWLSVLGLTLGFWSKPTAVLLLPAVWLRFRHGKALVITVLSLSLYGPHVGWSAANEWLPWSFQSGRVFAPGFESLLWLSEYAGGQLLLVGPLIFIAGAQLNASKVHSNLRYLKYLSLPHLIAVGIAALGMHVEANWACLMWPPVLYFLLSQYDDRQQIRLRRAQSGFAALTVFVLLGLLVFHERIPNRIGPDRNGIQLSRCLEKHFPMKPVLTMRYQDMALLSQTPTIAYLLASASKRDSQYNLWNDQIRMMPQCGDVVLSDTNHCPNQGITRQTCGRIITACICQASPIDSPEEL